MSAFEFFFSFYGLILGLSVAELLGGFARTLNRNPRPRFGLLTPLLVVFAALDVTTFWFQAWIIFRPAPFNLALLMLGLVIAGLFYISATLVFPRDEDQVEDLDAHFWRNKRTGSTVKHEEPKSGRNDPCPCGSGRKFKQCCGRPDKLN